MSIFSQLFGTSKRESGTSKRGFTLIELLVVIAIMTIITAVLLVRQQQFNSSTLLRSLAYSVALSVRQTQVYGVSAKVGTLSFADPGCAPSLNAPTYGLFFSQGDVTHYTLFADLNCNGQYDGPNELVQTFALGNGYVLSDGCLVLVSGSTDCASSQHNLTWVAVLFRRPNPEACIASNIYPAACASGATDPQPYKSISIQIISKGGSTRSITVNNTGEIAVGGAGS